MAESDDIKLDRILSHLDSAHTKMDAFNKRLDSIEAERVDSSKRLDATCARMDEWDKARKDASEKEEEAKKDAARKDAEEKEKEEKAKADAAKRDAEKEEQEKKDAAARVAAGEGEHIKRMQAQIDVLTRNAPPVLAPDIRQKMAVHKSRADRVAQAFGDVAGAPSAATGESEIDYRIRLVSGFKKHSKSYKDADLSSVQNEAILKPIEDAIYNDAMAEATNPSQVRPGVLIPQRIKDAADRTITRYVGDPNACWDQFNPPVRHVRRILTNGTSRVQ